MSRLIPKKLKGKKIMNWFTLATIGAAMAENPAIMTASGWKYDENGKLYLEPDKDSERLANNLAEIAYIPLGDLGFEAISVGVPYALKAIKNIKRLKNMKLVYTGVPHKPINMADEAYRYMDEEFPKYTGEIWTSNNKNYAELFARGNSYDTAKRGKIYKILVDTKTGNFLDTPTPAKDSYYHWSELPFEVDDAGKIVTKPSTLAEFPNAANNIEDAIKLRDLSNAERIAAQNKNFLWQTVPKKVVDPVTKVSSTPRTITDDIVRAQRRFGYDGTIFHNIDDGESIFNVAGKEIRANVPIDEIVLNKNTPHIVLPENKSKWSLLFKDLDDLTVGRKFKDGGRLIPKAQLGLKEQRIQANQLHKDLANQNWKEGNVLKAAYHLYKGTPGLGGQFENDYIIQSGVAPAVGLKGVPSPEAIKKAEAIATGTKAVGTSANVSKTISNSNALETGKGVSEVINYFKVKFKTMGLHPRVAKARNNPDFEKWYNKRCLYGYKHPEEQSKIATEVVDKVIKLENGIK